MFIHSTSLPLTNRNRTTREHTHKKRGKGARRQGIEKGEGRGRQIEWRRTGYPVNQ